MGYYLVKRTREGKVTIQDTIIPVSQLVKGMSSLAPFRTSYCFEFIQSPAASDA